MYNVMVVALLLLHGLGTFLGWMAAWRRNQRPGVAYVCFTLAIPFFGAALAWVFATAKEPDADICAQMMRKAEQQEAIFHVRDEAERIVPLEEAFLINQPKQRRELMLNLLKSDPRKYLDLLLLARFNEDQETAHYASVTLTEIQREMQLDLQKAQAAMVSEPENQEARAAYARLLGDYVNSGLVEGRLQQQQRQILQQTLEHLPEEARSMEMCALQVDNALALGMSHDAREQAQAMIRRWPRDERPYLKLLEVCVQTHDQYGLRELLKRVKKSKVAWTHEGLERIHYFEGKSA